MTFHYVKSDRFNPADLNNKQLRWFRYNTPHDISLQVKDTRFDGAFVLVATSVRVVPPFVSAGGVGLIDVINESLDQATVDKIEKAGASALLGGCDFVIFEASPEAAALCAH